MIGTRTSACSLVLVLLAVSPVTGAGFEEPDDVGAEALAPRPQGEVHRLDCAGNPRALWEAEPVVQYRDGDEIHQYWILADRPDLWSLATPEFESLGRYRERVRRALPDTSPLGMIRSNRERNPWLDQEYPNEDRVNRQVEAGVGRHRPMNCLESHVLAYQAKRFPLYEQPSEVVALFVKLSETPGGSGEGDLVKVYLAADDDPILPKPNWAVESVEADVARGWRFAAVFHNHTFDHSPDRGLIPVAAPSTNDLQVSVALEERLGLEAILVTDGFSTLELSADEFERLYRSVVGGKK